MIARPGSGNSSSWRKVGLVQLELTSSLLEVLLQGLEAGVVAQGGDLETSEMRFFSSWISSRLRTQTSICSLMASMAFSPSSFSTLRQKTIRLSVAVLTRAKLRAGRWVLVETVMKFSTAAFAQAHLCRR